MHRQVLQDLNLKPSRMAARGPRTAALPQTSALDAEGAAPFAARTDVRPPQDDGPISMPDGPLSGPHSGTEIVDDQIVDELDFSPAAGPSGKHNRASGLPAHDEGPARDGLDDADGLDF